MRFANEGEALTYIFRSIRRLQGQTRGPDEVSRDTTPTRRLLQACDLLDPALEFAVVTGSKGKGSTTAILAKLLQHLGHTTGTLTSPHLVSFRERIRVNGRAIPEADFVRITGWLAPEIDAIEDALSDTQYFSPQGIFLAIALKWFAEQGVKAAPLEVGRGGRYDDVAVVPNRLSLFTPIMLEHTQQLGTTLERIAWHKAGIIKAGSYAYSVPQATEVLDVLQAEASAQHAEFAWIAPMDMGEYLGATERGTRMRLGRYGDMTLSLLGRLQVSNATLAVQGAGNMHGRLGGIAHGSEEYVERIRAALADVVWPGRVQKMQDAPHVWVDGATTVVSANAFIQTLQDFLTEPLVTILATPVDRDYPGVYRVFGAVSRALVLTATDINPNVRFPDPALAAQTAQQFNDDVTHAASLRDALQVAHSKSGASGTILVAAAQPIVGELMQLYGLSFETI